MHARADILFDTNAHWHALVLMLHRIQPLTCCIGQPAQQCNVWHGKQTLYAGSITLAGYFFFDLEAGLRLNQLFRQAIIV